MDQGKFDVIMKDRNETVDHVEELLIWSIVIERLLIGYGVC